MKKTWNSQTLKLIACVTMTIDHIGAFILSKITVTSITQYVWLTNLNTLSRLVGRIAFPLFCFLMVVAYFHTSSKPKYFGRMVFFAFISQPLYSLAHGESWMSWNHLNIFITLAVGFGLIWLLDEIRKKNQVLFWFTTGAIACGLVWLEPLVPLQYGLYGLAMIFVFYLFYDHPALMAIGLLAVHFGFYYQGLELLSQVDLYLIPGITEACGEVVYGITRILMMVRLNLQLFGLFALLGILKFNGEKGKPFLPRLFFYFYYPLHILLFYWIGTWI